MNHNPPIIIIDGNFIGHTCRFTGEVYYQNRECGVIHAMLSRIIDISESYGTKKFCIVWDSRHSWRKKKYPWYKDKRRKNREEMTKEEKDILYSMYHQVEELKPILKRIGFANVFEQNGIEGDDIMAMIVRNYPMERIVLVASDHDLWQLLAPNVSMLTPRGDYLGKEFRVKDFEKEWGISPRLWHLVKALAGCATDEVPGVGRDIKTGELVARIGEKTVANFLAGKLGDKTKTYLRLVSDEAQIIKNRNLELVHLPHKKTRPIILRDDNFDWQEFENICREYRFKDFLVDRKDEWEGFFSLNGRSVRG